MMHHEELGMSIVPTDGTKHVMRESFPSETRARVALTIFVIKTAGVALIGGDDVISWTSQWHMYSRA